MYYQPTLERYIPTRNTMATWIDSEFIEGKRALKVRLAQSRSRVYISFNIWTSISQLLILGIYAHFLALDLTLQHSLLALRVLPEDHSGEGMAEVIKKVMLEYKIVGKWGVYISNNASANDSCCAALVRDLRLGEPITGRRARYFGHIVNLAAKAFIYS